MQSAADLREEADAPVRAREVDAKTDAAMKAATRFGDPMAARGERGDASGDAELSASVRRRGSFGGGFEAGRVRPAGGFPARAG